MRRILMVLSAGVIIVSMAAVMASTALGQARTETYNVSQPESFAFDNPCTGEPILVEGVFHHVVHVTETKNSYHYVIHTNSTDVTGTGEQTGDEYRFVNLYNGAGSGNVKGADTINETLSLKIVSEGSSPDFILQLVNKYTFDEDGKPSVGLQKVTAGCPPEVESSKTIQR